MATKTTQQQYVYVCHGVLCAINDIRLGIARSYYMDWANAMGYKPATARSYWSKAKRLINAYGQYDHIRFTER